jgi:hypothetical protein
MQVLGGLLSAFALWSPHEPLHREFYDTLFMFFLLAGAEQFQTTLFVASGFDFRRSRRNAIAFE